MAQEGGFWSSLPGIFTGIAAVIGAIGTLYGVLHSQPNPNAVEHPQKKIAAIAPNLPTQSYHDEVVNADREIAVVDAEIDSLQKEIKAEYGAGNQERFQAATSRLANAQLRRTAAVNRKVAALAKLQQGGQ
jgi:hypothetical protein